MAYARFLVLATLALGGLMTPAAAIELERIEADDGYGVVLVRGEFRPYDDVDDMLTRLALDGGVRFVTFLSPGGNPHAAMKLGRTIRRLGLGTIQPTPASCSSACTLAFLGGVARFAEPGSLGVHKSSFAPEARLGTAEAVSAIQGLTSDIIGYLIEMGVDPALMQVALAYDSDDMRYLSNSEMEKMRVVTTEGGSLAGPVIGTGGDDVETAAILPTGETADAALASIRHPLRATPTEDGIDVAEVRNATPVEILGQEGRWYRVRIAGRIAYAHETAVKVPGFTSATDDGKYVQTHSFSTLAEARREIARLPYPASAYQVANGWIAVTVAGKFSDGDASRVLAEGKAVGIYPDDAFKTYGNTYVRKVCCD
jgi:hypothetical protein